MNLSEYENAKRVPSLEKHIHLTNAQIYFKPKYKINRKLE
jgi:hypothetical protein